MAKILIVDDRESNLFTLENILKRLDVEIVRALTGEDALRATLNHDFALAILDVQMPGMDGYELASLMRSDARMRSIPLIFMSAVYSEEAYVFKGYESGGVDFIAKPFNPEILLSKVRIFLELNEQKTELIRQKATLEALVSDLEAQIEARKRMEREVEKKSALLESMNEMLRKSHDDLEIRVQERTVDLSKAMEKLEQSNRELKDFAFVASHDLQEPLRKIRTFSDRLKTAYRESLDEQGVDYLERMERAAQRMQSLIFDILKYSRMANRVEPFTSTSLKDSVKEAVMDLTLLIEETEAKIIVGELPSIEADPVQMRQLFQNLIGNALKYHGEHRPEIEVYHNSSCPDGFLEIHVKDNGIGFDECYLDKIFKPFQRLHGRQSPYEGTGMGLAISRRIVERHGGSITARSEAGKGAIFIVRLPGRHNQLRSTDVTDT